VSLKPFVARRSKRIEFALVWLVARACTTLLSSPPLSVLETIVQQRPIPPSCPMTHLPSPPAWPHNSATRVPIHLIVHLKHTHPHQPQTLKHGEDNEGRGTFGGIVLFGGIGHLGEVYFRVGTVSSAGERGVECREVCTCTEMVAMVTGYR